MAGVYRQYNLSVQIPYRVQFVCEKCGKKNSFLHTVKAKSAYSDKGALRQKTIEKRKVQAVGQLNKNKNALIEKISDEMSREKYHTIHLTCKCSQCSHLPVWAYPAWFRIAEIIKNISLYAAFMIFLFMCLKWNNHSHASWTPLLIAAAPAVLYYIGMFFYSTWQDKRIERLDAKYLPVCQLTSKK